MKVLQKIMLIGLGIYSLSCQETQKKEVSKQEIKLSNFTLHIPEGYELVEGAGMEKGILQSADLPEIKLFNFGQSPVSVESNVKRWESQLDSVIQTKTIWEENQLVSTTHIKAISQGAMVKVYGLIIPSADGPYYLKTTANIALEKQMDLTLKKISQSIKYE